MSYKDTFGGRLNEARKNKQLSQDSLAKQLGVSKQAVSNWENNQNHPDSKKLHSIGRVLSIDINWLLTGTKKDLNLDTGRSTGAGEVIIYSLKDISDLETAKNDGNIRPSLVSYFDASKSSFAITIEDNSMSPEFIEGDVVIIDPEVSPVPGDKVCALVDGMDDALFRTYKSSGLKLVDNSENSQFSLLPINNNWASINISGNGKLLGVMVEHRKPRRSS